MARKNVQAQTGNRVVLLVDDQIVGAAQSLRASDGYSLDAVSGIGDIHVIEHAPTMARHSVSLTQMVLKTNSLIAAGIIPENGDAALEGVVLDIGIQEKDSGRILRKYVDCSFDSGDLDVSKHQIMSTSSQWMALDVQGNAA